MYIWLNRGGNRKKIFLLKICLLGLSSVANRSSRVSGSDFLIYRTYGVSLGEIGRNHNSALHDRIFNVKILFDGKLYGEKKLFWEVCEKIIFLCIFGQKTTPKIDFSALLLRRTGYSPMRL
jgi:hypothetical protein